MHTLRVPTMVAALAFTAIGCTTQHPESPPSRRRPLPQRPRAPNVVVVKTSDYGFDAPDTVHAGLTTLRLVTNPGQEIHQVGLIRIDSGKTPADLFNAMKNPGPLPAWAKEIAGVNPPAPGQTADATLTLEPGNYLLVCFVPSPDGVPHVAKGMSRPMTVTGDRSPPRHSPVMSRSS